MYRSQGLSCVSGIKTGSIWAFKTKDSWTRARVLKKDEAIGVEGNSSGATIALLMISLVINRPLPRDLIMTGVISLKGRVSKVGSVKEKVVVAKDGGYRHVILPADNKAQWESISEDVKTDLIIDFVDTFDELYDIVF